MTCSRHNENDAIFCSLRRPMRARWHIARGFALVGDDLYVAKAWRKDSDVAQYHRHDDPFHFAAVVTANLACVAPCHF